MKYTTRASDLPPFKIPEGWEAYQPGTEYYMDEKYVFTLGDALIETQENWENIMLEQREAIVLLLQNVGQAERLLEMEKATAIGEIRRRLEEARQSPDWRHHRNIKERNSLYGLSRADLRLRVIDDLRGVDPDPSIKQYPVTFPEDGLMDGWHKLAVTGSVGLYPGYEDEARFMLYHPDFDQVSLPAYAGLVQMINRFSPIRPRFSVAKLLPKNKQGIHKILDLVKQGGCINCSIQSGHLRFTKNQKASMQNIDVNDSKWGGVTGRHKGVIWRRAWNTDSHVAGPFPGAENTFLATEKFDDLLAGIDAILHLSGIENLEGKLERAKGTSQVVKALMG